MIVDFSHRAPAENMAMDEALLRTAKDPLLRFYDWEAPCISIGYFQPLSEARERFPRRPVVRRWTGGGAVEHGQDLTFSVIVPRKHSLARLRPSDCYWEIHRAVLSALRLPEAAIVCKADSTPGGCCFEKPVPGDIILKGRKLCGGAQRRTRHGLLHQGSIACIPEDPEFPGRLAEALGFDASMEPISAEVEHLARELVVSRYGRDAWLDGRHGQIASRVLETS